MLMRWLLAACILLSPIVVLAHRLVPHGGGAYVPTISGFNFGTVFKYDGHTTGNANYMNGDTYGNTWSDDGNTYTLTNDSQGPSQSYSGNLLFGRISTFDSTMIWTLTNQMTQWGLMGTSYPTGTASFKTSGLISIANNLYFVSWRRNDADGSSCCGKLIKSVDHGANWAPYPPQGPIGPYASPDWPGNDYPIGWVQYGQNYTGTGPDNSNNYVYALIRNKAAGATTQNQRIARVAVANIGNQNIADWTYYQGGDGMLDANWGALSSAASMFPSTVVDGGASIQYLPRYQQYVQFILIRPGSGFAYTWDVYVASHPWGPWTRLGGSPQFSDPNYGLGFPFIAPKSVTNGGQSIVVLASSSNYGTTTDCPSGYYCLYQVPVSFSP
jgi:hypothetical protein